MMNPWIEAPPRQLLLLQQAAQQQKSALEHQVVRDVCLLLAKLRVGYSTIFEVEAVLGHVGWSNMRALKNIIYPEG